MRRTIWRVVAQCLLPVLLLSVCSGITVADGTLPAPADAPDFGTYAGMEGMAFSPAVEGLSEGARYTALWDGAYYTFTVGENIFASFEEAYAAAGAGTPNIFALSGNLGSITITGPVRLYGYYFGQNPNQASTDERCAPALNPLRARFLESTAGNIRIAAGVTGVVGIYGLLLEGILDDSARGVSALPTAVTLENTIVSQQEGVAAGSFVFNLNNANNLNAEPSGAQNRDSFTLRNCRLERVITTRISGNYIPPTYMIDGLVTLEGATPYFGFAQWRRYFKDAVFTMQNCYFENFSSPEGKNYFLTMEGLNKYNGPCAIQFKNNVFKGDCSSYILGIFVKKEYRIEISGNTFLTNSLTGAQPFFWNISYDKNYEDYLEAADVSAVDLSDRVSITRNRFIGYTCFTNRANSLTVFDLSDNFFTDDLTGYRAAEGGFPNAGDGWIAPTFWVDYAMSVPGSEIPAISFDSRAVAFDGMFYTIYTGEPVLNLYDYGFSNPAGVQIRLTGEASPDALPLSEGLNIFLMRVYSYDGSRSSLYYLSVYRTAQAEAARRLSQAQIRLQSGLYTDASAEGYEALIEALRKALEEGTDPQALLQQLDALEAGLVYREDAQADFLYYDLFSDLRQFKIGSPAGWKQFAAVVNGGTPLNDCVITLTADLDFGGEEIVPVGGAFSDYNVPNLPAFYGTLEGNGHTLSHFVIYQPEKVGVGLFGRASCAVIRNLRIGQAAVTGLDKVGGIAGFGDGTLFENCASAAAVTAVDGTNGNAGLVSQARAAKSPYDGKNYTCRLSGCINYGTVVSAKGRSCGIIAWGQSTATMENCVNQGVLEGTAVYPFGTFSSGTDLASRMLNCWYQPQSGEAEAFAAAFAAAEAAQAAWNCGFALSGGRVVFTDQGEAVYRAAFACESPAGTYYDYGIAGEQIAFDIPGYAVLEVVYNGAARPLAGLTFGEDCSLSGTAEAIRYALRYRLGEGRFLEEDAPGWYTVERAPELPGALAVAREGYLFAGWYEDEAFTGARILSIAADEMKDYTLYARYVPITRVIETPEQLLALAEEVNAGNSMEGEGVSLAADLDLSGVDFPGIGNSMLHPFEGVFQGNGHLISGLRVSGRPVAGLIGALGSRGTVAALRIRGSVSGAVAGGVVGNNAGGLIEAASFDGAVSSTATPLKIISQNLRVDTTSDLHGAADRHTPVKDVLLAQDPDVIGFQEANEGWLKYLPGDFDGYSYIWTWRGAGDNNTTKGKEATPIFYKTDKFDLLESGTFWLSETPDTPSWCFNENMNRTVAWVKLRLKETGEVFCFFNTHYPLDEQSRLQSAAVLREKVAEICGGILPYFITADFNMSPDSPPYNSMSEWCQDLGRYAAIDETNNAGTYNGFNVKPGDRIDFCFGQPQLTTTPFYKVLLDTYIDSEGRECPPSDHYGIYLEILLQSGSGGITGSNQGTVQGCYAQNSGSAAVFGGALAGKNLGMLAGCFEKGAEACGVNYALAEAEPVSGLYEAAFALNEQSGRTLWGADNQGLTFLPDGEQIWRMIYLDSAGNTLYEALLPESAAGSFIPDLDTAGTVFDSWEQEARGNTLYFTPVMAPRTFTVTFTDAAGLPVSTQQIAYGKAASAPQPPEEPGLLFLGWDQDFSAVTANLTVRSLWREPGRFTLTLCSEGAGTAVERAADTAAGGLCRVAAEGENFLYWREGDRIVAEAPVFRFALSGDTVLTAVFATPGAATVTFTDGENRILSVARVAPGGAAQAPEAPARPGMVFTGWDQPFDAVSGDLLVRAVYAPQTAYSVLAVGGSVLESGPFYWGDTVTVTRREAPDGLAFAGWSLDGRTLLTTRDTFTVRVFGNLTLQALYQPAAQVPISLVPAAGGAVALYRSAESGYQVLGSGILYSSRPERLLLLEGADGTAVCRAADPALTRMGSAVFTQQARFIRGYLLLLNERTGAIETFYTPVLEQTEAIS